MIKSVMQEKLDPFPTLTCTRKFKTRIVMGGKYKSTVVMKKMKSEKNQKKGRTKYTEVSVEEKQQEDSESLKKKRSAQRMKLLKIMYSKIHK
jgi:hypothetical protein